MRTSCLERRSFKSDGASLRDYGHFSRALDFAVVGPRQFALSRERQRRLVSTLTLWPTFRTG
jgi:hypothetical protein